MIIGICLIVKNYELFVKTFLMGLSALSPLIMGCAIAYVFNIFMTFFEKHYFPKKEAGFISYTRRPVCLLLTFAITVTIIAVLLKMVIPELIDAVELISMEIPKYAVMIKDFAVDRLKDYPEIQQKIYKINIDWTSLTHSVLDFVKVGASGLIITIAEFIGAFASSVTRIVIAIIFAIYLLIRKDKLKSDIARVKNAYFSERVNKVSTEIFHTANNTFKSFFVGQFTEAIILGVLCIVGMSILKIPYAAMTGAVIGVTALIPIVGAYLGAAVGAFMICTVDPMKALIFLIFLVILQQFEGNVIYPKVVGTSVGLPGIWVLAAVTVGGSLCGVIGMLLGVPVFATVYKLSHELLDEREQKLGIAVPVDTKEESKKKKKEKRKLNFSFKHKNKK